LGETPNSLDTIAQLGEEEKFTNDREEAGDCHF